ncbi:PhnD/SsuA/transferrin family substrate-binding protein [Trichocoleus desertorum AS-A10]|uniref:phosphate/phosphite/phosphonate ABC transporter substrate-binding protein n=1 Tax=Trichocoleus desertorum TaxID=1481672 RepID=UPI00329835EE
MPEKLRFAVTDAKGLEELQRDYEPFRVALEEVLETKIEFFPVENLIAAAPAMLSGEIDFAWAGPSEYVVLRARAQAIPLVTLQRQNYRTVIAVYAGSGIQSLADLKGKTLDVWQLGAAASHLGAVKILINAGVNPLEVKIIEPENDDRLGRLKTGKIDAASRALSRYLATLKEEGLSAKDYPVLAQGPLLPGDVFAVSSQINPQVVEVMRSRMLERREKLMQAIAAREELAKRFRGGTLSIANDTDYNMIREVYRVIGQSEVIQ